MRKKIIDVIVMASMLTCILGGCGNTRESGVTEQKGETSAVGTEATNAGEDKQEEILFWHSYSEGEEKVFTEQVLAAFEKAHPEIKEKRPKYYAEPELPERYRKKKGEAAE